MPLAIRFVRSLDEIVAPAVEFLSRPVDLFARQRIVVPTAGAKAWLTAKLVERLGASQGPDGQPARDGIVANVEFAYPGTISAILSDGPRPDIDPWHVDHLTFTILEVLTEGEHEPACTQVIERAGGPLLAARRIADQFDHYHFRRPAMILTWEVGKAELSPEADAAGDRRPKRLSPRDTWQFDLWRKVRAKVGEPSPPAREQEAVGLAPEAVLVAGLQGLSLHQIALLERLATMAAKTGRPCDVDVLLVHPSAPLRAVWASTAPPVSKDKWIAPTRGEPEPASGADPLVEAWLRGTRESQWLLASEGLDAAHDPAARGSTIPADAPLLARLKHTVASGERPDAAAGNTPLDKADQSVRIHRCHDLGRQAEVLHDAILHAFREIPGLEPHEVVILSPQIAKVAPHLEAVFNRDVTGVTTGGPSGAKASDKARTIHLPLLVADRGIREVSGGAELLAALIELVGSRCSVDGMLAVATHPLVLSHFGLGDKDVEIWQRCIERTKIRWGLDAARRSRSGLERLDLPAHTWRLGLERTLLGAVVPDGDPEPVLGGVVPLRHVDTADVTSLAPLVTIFSIIDDLDQAIARPQPVGTEARPVKPEARTVRAWCDLLEQALAQLAGVDSDELAVPLRELDTLRTTAAAAKGTSPAEVAVPWQDLKTILAATLTAPVGRQPLRTGVITATSLIPLRGVPFRVVCLAGYDDEAVAPREGDSEDLVNRQQFLGDKDRCLDVRRELLDCVLAAGDRLVITCTGMDVKNNRMLPLVTPLAEFTDFVARHGVAPRQHRGEHLSGIEIVHPRHACSRGNFVAGETGLLETDLPWSHDAAARAAAEALGQDAAPRATSSAARASVAPVEMIHLDWLAEFMHDPLWPYVHETLGIRTWRDDDLSIPATLPLELERLEKRSLRNDYIERLIAAADRDAFTAAWAAEVTTNGDVPVLGYGDDAIAEITQFAAALVALAADNGVPLTERHARPIAVPAGGLMLSGEIERCYPDADSVQSVVLVRPEAIETGKRGFLVAKALAGLNLLSLKASGGAGAARALVLSQCKNWRPTITGEPTPAKDVVQIREIRLAESIDAARAEKMLAELVQLYRQAASTPHGLFGETTTHLGDDIDKALDAFNTFTTQDGYSRSNEAVVFGGQPVFAEVFGDLQPTGPGPALDFYRRLKALTDLSWDRRARAYIYASAAP